MLLRLFALGVVGFVAAKKQPQTALELNFKNRVTKQLNNSVEAAAEHLVSRLSLGGGGPFGGYELELGDEPSRWRHSCLEVDQSRDSVELCALRQLHALTALCDVGDYVRTHEAAGRLVRAHLKALVGKELPTLGIKRTVFDGVDIWLYRKRTDGPPDDTDASPALQASALMALVRCADAVGQQKAYFQEAESWFTGLTKFFPEKIWPQALSVSFHKSGIVWESLSLVASYLPRESSFSEKLQLYISSLEAYLRKTWKEDLSTWSYASARALAIRHSSDALKSKQRKTVVTWAQEHVDRFLGREKKAKSLGDVPTEDVAQGIIAKIGGGGYTCGPLQGLTSLVAVLGADAQLLQVVLKLLVKDVERFQLGPGNLGPLQKAAPEGLQPELVGAFFRSDDQLKLEKRQSLRVDDVVMCAIAVSQALDTLDGIVAVEADEETLAQAGSAAGEEL